LGVLADFNVADSFADFKVPDESSVDSEDVGRCCGSEEPDICFPFFLLSKPRESCALFPQKAAQRIPLLTSL
jgi:hypothetical protein